MYEEIAEKSMSGNKKGKKRFDDPEWDAAFQKDREEYRAEIRMSDGKFIVNFRYSKEGKDYDYANTEKVYNSLAEVTKKLKSFFALEG